MNQNSCPLRFSKRLSQRASRDLRGSGALRADELHANRGPGRGCGAGAGRVRPDIFSVWLLSHNFALARTSIPTTWC